MTRTDSLVVGTLVVLLALIAGLVGVPALSPAARPPPTPSQSPAVDAATRPYREGVLGHPVSVSPLSARTQADRDLVALVFSGLVRNGPNGTLVPDLAERWSVDPTGATWTFQLRDDARRGTTASRSPRRTSRSRSASSRTRPTRAGRRLLERGHRPGGRAADGDVHPQDAARRVPPGRDPADRAGPPAGGRPGRRPAGSTRPAAQPIGSGPFAVASLDRRRGRAHPGSHPHPTAPRRRAPRRDPPIRWPPPRRSAAPTRPVPYLAGIEFHFFDDQKALADAYRSGESRCAPRVCRRRWPRSSAATDGQPRRCAIRARRLTTVLLNLRPGHPEFVEPAVRTALLAGDRPTPASSPTRSRWRPTSATGPIPPASALFDPAADPPVPYDADAAGRPSRPPAGRRPPTAGTCPGRRHRSPSSCSARTRRRTRPRTRRPSAVARDWTALGLSVTHAPLPPARVRDGPSGERRLQRRGRRRHGRPRPRPVSVARLEPDRDRRLEHHRPAGSGARRAARGGPRPGHRRRPQGRLLDAPEGGSRRVATCSRWPSRTSRSSFATRVIGPAIRQVADPADRFWDVLTWRLAAGR